MRSRRIGDLDLHDLDFNEAVEWICQRAAGANSGTVCTPNADYVVRARHDEDFKTAIMSCDLRVPDGMWIIYASRLSRRPLRATVTGRLLVPAIAARAAKVGLSVALFGATDGVAAKAADVLRSHHDGLEVVAALSPPLQFRIGSPEDIGAIQIIKDAKPAVIFVALGAPKQELWIQAHRRDFPESVLIGVGAAFDIIAGRYREAPRWMTRTGFEWAFRLVQEPRRLAKRYLVDDPWIIWWALKTRIRAC